MVSCELLGRPLKLKEGLDTKWNGGEKVSQNVGITTSH